MPEKIAALVVNYNTAGLTLQCVASIQSAGVAQILVLDNGSDPADRRVLSDGLAGIDVDLIQTERNLGFAQGCNLLLERVLANESFSHVLLINSDATLVAGGLARLVAAAENAPMVGGRVDFHPDGGQGDQLESLGITLYRSMLASNRKRVGDTLVGPTGACALYATTLLRELRERHGYVFDPDYFCYAEDTDLCLRAHLLGHDTVCVEECVALHWGQASSGGRYNDFILFHGIRNSIWTLAKTTPMATLLKNSPWIVILHLGILILHLRRGKARVLARLYSSALRGLPGALRKRARIQGSRRITAAEFNALVTPDFYERDYVRNALAEIVPWRGSRPR